jgi:hypothetical protein
VAALEAVRRLPSGGVRVRLTPRERDILLTLPGQLRPLMAGEYDLDTPAGWVRERLFPSAYEDPLDEYDYRELLGTTVPDQRLAAIEEFARTLEGGTLRRLTWTTDLSDDQAHAWLSAVNDARLTLAMVLGVTDESVWEGRQDSNDPTKIVLFYLGWLQESLLDALTPALGQDG